MRDRVLAWLADNVPTSRLKHILGVEQTAVELAGLHHLDTEKAARAGLMHDLAKCFKPYRLLQVAIDAGVEIDEVAQANPHLLHAPVSAIVAKNLFGESDPEVLDAIAYHTLGQPGMSKLSCVVFVADSVEPTRGSSPELAALRQASQNDLYKAVWLTCDYSLSFLLETRCLIHPRTIGTRNWALQKASEQVAVGNRAKEPYKTA